MYTHTHTHRHTHTNSVLQLFLKLIFNVPLADTTKQISKKKHEKNLIADQFSNKKFSKKILPCLKFIGLYLCHSLHFWKTTHPFKTPIFFQLLINGERSLYTVRKDRESRSSFILPLSFNPDRIAWTITNRISSTETFFFLLSLPLPVNVFPN